MHGKRLHELLNMTYQKRKVEKIYGTGTALVPFDDDDTKYWVIRNGKKVGWGIYYTEREIAILEALENKIFDHEYKKR